MKLYSLLVVKNNNKFFMGVKGLDIGSWIAIGIAVAVAIGLFGKSKKKK